MMPALLRVMYAPLDYMHPDRFTEPAEGLSSLMQQTVNHHLIQRYQLPVALDFTLSSRDLSERLVEDWKLLRKVAWLLGCKIARGGLAMTGQMAGLPGVAHRFIALPVPCPAAPATVSVTASDIESLGARYLYQLRAHLPAALAHRLPLVFAPDSEEEGNSTNNAIPELSFNRSLFTFAFDYAKNSND